MSAVITSELTVSICTIGDRIYRALELVKSGPRNVSYLIVHQKSNKFEEDVELIVRALTKIEKINIIYHTLDSIGVAYARNAAIESAKTQYLLFTDDDVSLTNRLFDALSQFSASDSDVATFICLNEKNEPRRKYSTLPFVHNRISIISIGTVEVMVKVKSVQESGCLFPVNMGAGQYLSVADEPVYLARCLSSGLKIYFFPIPIVKHPSESSGGVLKTNGSLKARGLAIKEIFGPAIGFFMLIIFVVKSRGKFSYQSGVKGFLHSVYYIFNGFFRYCAK